MSPIEPVHHSGKPASASGHGGDPPQDPGLGSGHRLEVVACGQALCGSGSLPQQGTPVRGTRKLGEGCWPTSHSQNSCLGGNACQQCCKTGCGCHLCLGCIKICIHMCLAASLKVRGDGAIWIFQIFGFSKFLDCCLENCNVLSSLAFPLYIRPPFFWGEAQTLH